MDTGQDDGALSTEELDLAVGGLARAWLGTWEARDLGEPLVLAPAPEGTPPPGSSTDDARAEG
jgi:hypothetical protein